MVTRIARYTDGTPVRKGDLIRYRQTSGGILPASKEWTYGVAMKYPHTPESVNRMRAFNKSQGGKTLLDPDELYLCADVAVGGYSTGTRKAYYYLVGNIVERDA